jgi:hypothetical protein
LGAAYAIAWKVLRALMDAEKHMPGNSVLQHQGVTSNDEIQPKGAFDC